MSSPFVSTACPRTPALYRPRRPERTLLHSLVRENLETFLVRYLFRHERETVGAVLRIFMRALETTLRRKSPGAPAASRFGAVAFVHHFGMTNSILISVSSTTTIPWCDSEIPA